MQTAQSQIVPAWRLHEFDWNLTQMLADFFIQAAANDYWVKKNAVTNNYVFIRLFRQIKTRKDIEFNIDETEKIRKSTFLRDNK